MFYTILHTLYIYIFHIFIYFIYFEKYQVSHTVLGSNVVFFRFGLKSIRIPTIFVYDIVGPHNRALVPVPVRMLTDNRIASTIRCWWWIRTERWCPHVRPSMQMHHRSVRIHQQQRMVSDSIDG